MEVIVDRSSVCMGDDCFSHAKTYILDDNATYMDLFECLKNDKYFPSISGNNVVWVLTNEHYNCIFSYFTKTDKFNPRLSEKFLKEICRRFKQVKASLLFQPTKMEREYISNV